MGFFDTLIDAAQKGLGTSIEEGLAELEAEKKRIEDEAASRLENLSPEERAFIEKSICDFSAGRDTIEAQAMAESVAAAKEYVEDSLLASLALAIQGKSVDDMDDIAQDRALAKCNELRSKDSPQR